MPNPWELSDEKKKEIEEKRLEMLANMKKEQADKKDGTDDVDTLDAREREITDENDENIR